MTAAGRCDMLKAEAEAASCGKDVPEPESESININGNILNIYLAAETALYYTVNIWKLILKRHHKEKEIEDDVKETDILPGKTEASRNAQAALLRLLNVLFSVSLPPEEKSRILEEEFQIPKKKEMEEEMILMGNLGQGIEDRALARGRREGVELGRRKGVERGRAEGEAIGRLKALFDLVRDGKLTISAAAEAAAMDLSEFERKYNESCQ